MKSKFRTGDLVHPITPYIRCNVGVGIVMEYVFEDIIKVYWLKDQMTMTAAADSIKKVEANESKV